MKFVDDDENGCNQFRMLRLV